MKSFEEVLSHTADTFHDLAAADEANFQRWGVRFLVDADWASVDRKLSEELVRLVSGYFLGKPVRIVPRHSARHRNSGFDQKTTARHELRLAVKRGEVVKPDQCSRCKSPVVNPADLHAHHEDYTKPLAVVWLCAPCHGKEDDRRVQDWHRGTKYSRGHRIGI